MPCIHEQETSRSVCILHLPLFKTALAKQRGLLIPCRTGNRNPPSQNPCIRISINTTGRFYLRQHLCRNIQFIQQFFIPAHLMNIKKHRAGGVRIIRNMHRPLSQVPYQPGVHRSKQQFPLFCPFPCPFHMFQYPRYFCCRKIGIGNQPCFLSYPVSIAFLLQHIYLRRRPAALPDNGIINWKPCLPIPYNGRFPLIGNPYSANVFCPGANHRHRFHSHRHLGRPDFHGIMLHPARIRVNLGKLLLRHAHYLPLLVK